MSFFKRFLLFNAFLFFPFFRCHGLVDFISVSGNPPALNIASATAGSQPNSVSNSSTTYAITTIGIGERITGQLNRAMPTGTTLRVSLQAPSGSTSQGSVILTTTPVNLVTNLPLIGLLISGLSITYQLSATVSAGVVASQSVIVTFTVS